MAWKSKSHMEKVAQDLNVCSSYSYSTAITRSLDVVAL